MLVSYGPLRRLHGPEYIPCAGLHAILTIIVMGPEFFLMFRLPMFHVQAYIPYQQWFLWALNVLEVFEQCKCFQGSRTVLVISGI
jgi:hypothetical protein